MSKKKITSIISLIVLLIIYFFQQKNNDNTINTEEIVAINNTNFNYLPTSTTGQIITHNSYNLSYSEKHEQAEWVAYTLTNKDLINTNFKRPYFNEDPKVRTKSAHWRSYKNSGYDRGHLCPAGDRKASKKLYDEAFFTSNVSPQKHSFNAGIWNKLEQKTRYWAKKHHHLYVITGAILEDNLKTIGKDKVSVPKYFYKILLDYTKPEIKTIAFLIPHKESKKPLYNFIVSIDEIEKKTGINFFPELPNKLEENLEATKNYKNWSFR